MNEHETAEFLDVRRKAAEHIDSETAEVSWTYALIVDPYGIDPNVPEELHVVGRAYFARSPDSDIWVSFDDLQNAVAKELWKKYQRQLQFPAGLPETLDSIREDGEKGN